MRRLAAFAAPLLLLAPPSLDRSGEAVEVLLVRGDNDMFYSLEDFCGFKALAPIRCGDAFNTREVSASLIPHNGIIV